MDIDYKFPWIAAKVHFIKIIQWGVSGQNVVHSSAMGNKFYDSNAAEANSSKLRGPIKIHKRLWNFQTVMPSVSQTSS